MSSDIIIVLGRLVGKVKGPLIHFFVEEGIDEEDDWNLVLVMASALLMTVKPELAASL